MNYVYIDYTSSQQKQLRDICIYEKYLEKRFNSFLGIGIPYLLMNSLSCYGFTKNIGSNVILLCPSRMLEYYLSKGFVIL